MTEKRPPMKNEGRGIKGKVKLVRGFLSRLFYIISLVWETAPLLFISMIFLCLVDGLMPVVGSYITKFLFDGIQLLILGENKPSGGGIAEIFEVLRPVLFLFFLQLIYQFIKRVLDRLNGMVNVMAGELVVNHIKLKIITKAKTVDMQSFDAPEFYEKLENANREASMRPINILISTFRVISSGISIVSFIIVLATLSTWVPIVIILAAVPGAIANYYYRNRNFRYMRIHSKDRRAMNYYSDLMVNKDYAKEIKILGLGDTFIAKYKGVFKSYFKGLRRLVIRESVTRIIVSLVFSLASSALFVYVAYDVVFGNGLIGDYSLYTGALSSVASYVATLVTATATIYEGTLFIDNMIEFMKEERTVVAATDAPPKISRGTPHKIELKNVSFKYPGTDKYVIKDLSLSFSSGDSVVLVGLNGAGKTTLIKLIMRLYDVTEGEITLDGVNIKEYKPEDYYNLFGIIFQDFGKYADTVKENIRLGDTGREPIMAEIVSSAESADAASFISALPSGYDTPLTRIFEEGGVELSGGQWQKLSVARAFYKESDILILDEPTASLDALAEEAIFNRFATLSEGKISIFVSHRLSSAVTAGKIVVLSDGELIEEGKHEELMSLRGEYYKLFSTQAHRYTGLDIQE